MNKKIGLRILAGLGAVLIVVVMVSAINAFYGNPISKGIAKKNMASYVETKYPDLDVRMGEVKYEFKFGQYFATVASETSKDLHFTVYCDSYGKVDHDDYEYSVENGMNTFMRVSEEFEEQVLAIIKPVVGNQLNMAIAELDKEEIDKVQLPLDASLDITNPPTDTHLSIYVFNENPKVEEACQLLQKINEALKAKNVTMDTFSINLDKKETKNEFTQDAVYLYEVPRKIVESPDILTVIDRYRQ